MIYFADFETTTNLSKYYQRTGDTTVWLTHMIDINGENSYLGVSILDFMKWLEGLNNEDTIYFHNLSFDGDFIIKWLVNHKWYLNNVDAINPNEFYVFRNGQKIYYIKLNLNNKIIHLQCSYLLLNTSISQLGNSVNIQKIDETINKDEFYNQEPKPLNQVKKELIDYIKRDVEIARLSYINFKQVIESLSFVNEEIDLTQYLTVTSLIRKLLYLALTKYLKSKNLNCHPAQLLEMNEKDYEWTNELLAGGLTQFNLSYLGRQEMKSNVFIDVNSAYPAVMTQPLPWGKLSDKPIPKFQNIKFYRIKIIKGKIKPQYNFLAFWPNKQNETYETEIWHPFFNKKVKIKQRYRYCQTLTEHVITLYDCEFQALKQFYDLEYEILDIKYVKANPYLREYVKELYKYKKLYKSQKKEGYTHAIKILLNSTYGSLCMKNQYSSYFYFKDNAPEIFNNGKDDYQLMRECKNYSIGYYKCYEYEGGKPRFVNRIAASYITARQRTKLLRKILTVEDPNKNFVYCDTDSILFANLSDKDFKKVKHADISKRLGDWGIEKITNKAWEINIYGAKKYMLKDLENDKILKDKFAGVDTPFKWEKVNELMVYLEDANLVTKRVKSGILLVKQDKILKKGVL